MAKITIQKKTQVTNPFEEISKLLNIPHMESVYPYREMEPWRRFDPVKLLPFLTESVRQGATISKVNLENGNGLLMQSAAEWMKHDEIFLQKTRKNLGLFKKAPATEFFEHYITKSVSNDNQYILRIGKNQTVDPSPTITISPLESDKLCFNIFYIYCEENSRATINLIKKSARFDLSLIYIFQEKNSEIHLRYLDEDESKTSHGVHFIKSYQEERSKSKSGIYSINANQNKKVFIENKLLENSQSEYMGIFLGRFSHVDHDFAIEHSGSYSKSDLLFKMSVMDDSYGIFWGDTEITPGTRGCEAYQQNKNLILGNHSRIDAIPKLGIRTENVIASHGSATGEISEDEIFYMMSRGLSYEESRKLLLRGFFEDVLRKSFEFNPDTPDIFLERIWANIQNILGVEINS